MSWLTSVSGRCWLKGFGIASRLPRERQFAESPELVSGTLAYMAPADRTDEPFDRFPERSLFTRCHFLSNADWESSLHGIRTHGVGSLPHRATASSAKRTAERRARDRLSDHFETSLENRRGPLPDRCRFDGGPEKMPD
jgi:hypothetical protein